MNGRPPVSGISELVSRCTTSRPPGASTGTCSVSRRPSTARARRGATAYLVGDTARLGLWTEQVGLAGGQGGTHVHYAFDVEDAAIDPLKERIEGAGAEVEGPIQLGPGRAIYVTDPDGRVVEFWSQDMGSYAANARSRS